MAGMIAAFLNPEGTLLHAGSDELDRVASGLSSLLRAAELIPVTALDEEALLNVPAAFTSWQVLLHGAVLLDPDGAEDPAWRRLTVETLDAAQGALELAAQAAGHVSALAQLDLDLTRTERHGRLLRVELRHPYGLPRPLDQAERELKDWLAEGPLRDTLRLERTPDALRLLPRDLRPELAVNYLLSQLDAEFTLGVSALPGDAAFLALCDYAMVPGSADLLDPAPAERDDEE
ncbi:HAD superfamily hydrolase [Deinococcus grandis]|uniref:HAD superfamily hydrolase n=2 Tax=Deinococcus grandis TaxID=57498 RepID=A0A100HKX0_9DEIO|nr:hypothetical protein DEGR_06450 [Deinococcus grandis]GAQ22583.1 HAD superfamily hydrolase [Deinococcus grandis]